jgi:hypothetical protein
MVFNGCGLCRYLGPTLLQAVDLFEEPLRNTFKPLRLVIAELVKSRTLGQAAVSGKLESGALRIGSKVSSILQSLGYVRDLFPGFHPRLQKIDFSFMVYRLITDL